MNATLRMWSNRFKALASKCKREGTGGGSKKKTKHGDLDTIGVLAKRHGMERDRAYGVMVMGYIVIAVGIGAIYNHTRDRVNPDSIATPKELVGYTKGKPLDEITCVNNKLTQIGTNVTYREIDVLLEICAKETLLTRYKK